MTKNFLKSLMLSLWLALVPFSAHAITGSTYPSQVMTNQFGEKSINAMNGGSNQLDCSFTVAAADAAGKGITGLAGHGCASVFMHTSQTPATGNPNPAVGYILVNLASNFYGYVNNLYGIVSPNSGTPINVTTGVTGGLGYVITSLGTTSLAQWQNLGLPVGLTPALGQAFIAPGTTVSTGTGQIQVPAAIGAGVALIDVVGDPSTMVSATVGAQVLLRVLAATNSSTTTLLKTAPADGSVIHLRISMLPLSSQLH